MSLRAKATHMSVSRARKAGSAKFVLKAAVFEAVNGGLIDAAAMPVKIWDDAIKGACTVENTAAETEAMGAWSDHSHVAFVPGTVEKRPGFGHISHNLSLYQVKNCVPC